MNQRQFIHEFNKSREPFNADLFKRLNENMVNHMLKVIYSVERNGSFVFKVHSWRLVQNYAEIQQIMCDYENSLKKGKNKKKINPYEYINLKDTDMWLLLVNFYLKIKDEEQIVPIIIQIPIYTNKYYFRLSGNYYLPNLQIVDGSTFNSTTNKNSTSDTVTLKTILMSLKIYKNTYTLKSTDGTDVSTVYYSMTAFNKTFGVFKYILAKFGLYGTMKFMGFEYIKFLREDPGYDDHYTFKTNKCYITVPKVLYDADYVLQSFICNVYMTMNNKIATYEGMFTRDFWIESLGGEFGRYTLDKGLSLLESLEGIYDIATHEAIRLPEENKATIYHILRWIITQYSDLMERDNLDLHYKRIRLEEYIASLYAMKLASIIHRFGDVGANLNMELATKYMRGLKPSYLIDTMMQCKFINCKNSVNDIDTFRAIKYTMNLLSGMGEKDNNKLPNVYKQCHYSQLGRLDQDSSTKGNPGVSGTLTAYCDITPDGFFTDYQEPLTWDDTFGKIMNEYKQSIGVKQLLKARSVLTNDNSNEEKLKEVSHTVESMKKLLTPVIELKKSKKYFRKIIPLEESGLIYIEKLG